MAKTLASSEWSGQFLRQYIADYWLPEVCVEEYLDKINFLDASCFRILLSKLLGYAIVAGFSIVKVPQIVKLLGSKSSAGISFPSVLLELFALTTTLVYSVHYKFPLSAWGESLFLLIETAVIAVLILLYRQKPVSAVIYITVQVAATSILLSGLVPADLLKVMQAVKTVIVLLSKVMQIVENQKNRSTGQLSATTVFLLTAGSVIRVFTSIQETGDRLVVLFFVLVSVTNAVLCGQIVYYWKAAATPKQQSDKKLQ